MFDFNRKNYPILKSNPTGHTSQGQVWVRGEVIVNSHPWLDDLRAMAQMLDGKIEIPHGELEPSTDGFGMVFISDCDLCRRAFSLRFNYILSKENDGKVIICP